ncbi:hypothetical protein OIE13_21025 [Streptosporangium sp. NBC_01810]|uniref:hypothetical protein n=1 Tax=Streptosporangium sp. NBC_01810 TaxID=2975951 RepID=UPI002DD8675A|nr:hypothetical protein [Streptosporangium sp. NBC_01810]WSA23443.1 hypothetical protein OIE13_21025 [Streptosporangium sp. NBC_01810]
MPRDFYATVAQILPVLLLAFIWDSRFLHNLRNQRRRPRREDPVNGVYFWTKQRVRVYSLVIAVMIITDLALCALVLANLLPDGVAMRVVVLVGLLLSLATLLNRVWMDILHATREVEIASAASTPAPEPDASTAPDFTARDSTARDFTARDFTARP